MVPDEQPGASPEQSQSTAPRGPRRRSRRGGRRHGRRRAPRPEGATASSDPADATDANEVVEAGEPIEQTGDSVESPGFTETEESREPMEAAEEFRAEPSEPEPAEAAPPPSTRREVEPPSISKAIDHVNQVIAELRNALIEMEDVLELLELAERQKIDDEREIESLQRALRQLHRSGQGGGHRR